MTYEIFKVNIEGQAYYGTYRFQAPRVHVTSVFGSKSAPRGKEWPADVAARLLREIMAESLTEIRKEAA